MKIIQVIHLAIVSVYATLATWWILVGGAVGFGGYSADYYGFPFSWIIHTQSCFPPFYCSSSTTFNLIGFGVDMVVYMAVGYGVLQVFKGTHLPKRYNPENDQ